MENNTLGPMYGALLWLSAVVGLPLGWHLYGTTGLVLVAMAVLVASVAAPPTQVEQAVPVGRIFQEHLGFAIFGASVAGVTMGALYGGFYALCGVPFLAGWPVATAVFSGSILLRFARARQQ